MKTVKFLAWFLTLAIFVFACQKEVSRETGNTATASDGSLQGAGGACLGNVVAGTYKKDTALTTSNYVDVQINVNTPGTYLVYTDTVNGMYFRATGTFTIAGANTVRLMGTGTPLAAGTNSFTVNYDSTQCNFSITTLASGGGSAAYTFVCGSSADSLTIGTAPNSLDTIHVNVNVTTAGSYSIVSSTANGVTYSSGSQTFSTTGVQTVVLTASGTPTGTAGVQNITVTNGTSSCSYPITFLAASPTSAVYTLVGAPGACGSFTPQGVYVVGTALTNANTVSVQVNVTTAGNYSITTNTVSGISFSASGTFSGTGTQSLLLTGAGTPTASGSLSFTVTTSTTPPSTCTFVLTVESDDYFPRTTNSHWTYAFDADPTDTIRNFVIAPTLSAAGNTWNIFMGNDGTTTDSAGYYRRSGTSYSQYLDVAAFFGATTPSWGQYVFLNSATAVNTAIISSSFPVVVGTSTINVRIKETNLSVAGTLTIGTQNFSNVIKVKEEYEAFNGTAWVPAFTNGGNAVYSFKYFSRGVGLIKWDFLDDVNGVLLAQDIMPGYQVF